MSAARPTWTSAVGATQAPTMQYSSRDLTAHSKLKLRTAQQRQQTLEFERRPLEATAVEDEDKDLVLSPTAVEPAEIDGEPSANFEINVSSQENEDEEEEEEDDDDDTEALLRELEKIKKERDEERSKKAQEQLRKAVEANPLTREALSLSSARAEALRGGSFAVKRRWDDDVVFKNQGKKEGSDPKKRFINDTLRSDFHRKFMNRYIN